MEDKKFDSVAEAYESAEKNLKKIEKFQVRQGQKDALGFANDMLKIAELGQKFVNDIRRAISDIESGKPDSGGAIAKFWHALDQFDLVDRGLQSLEDQYAHGEDYEFYGQLVWGHPM